jgi:nucleoside-diphosphate-sugar epimerase
MQLERSYKWLVTGGAGFIGSHLVEELLNQGQTVVVLDNLSWGRRENLFSLPSVEFIEGDIRDPGVVAAAMHGVDFVLHQAAIGSVPRSFKEPELYHDVNVNGTRVVLEQARRFNVKRVVLASSSSVYGDAQTRLKTEGKEGTPLSPYAMSKATMESDAALYWNFHGLDTVCLRYFNVYGPRQRPDGPYAAVIPRWISSALSSGILELYGTGEQVRDFCFVKDVVRANLLAATAKNPLGPRRVFNVAGGRGYSLNEVAQTIATATGKDLRIFRRAAREGDVPNSMADLTLSCRHLGYRPDRLLIEGIEMTVAYFRGQRPPGAVGSPDDHSRAVDGVLPGPGDAGVRGSTRAELTYTEEDIRIAKSISDRAVAAIQQGIAEEFGLPVELLRK